MSKILLFGSDAISHHTLQTMVRKKPDFAKRISLLGPPKPRNKRQPLYEFHSYAQAQNIPFFFQSNFNKKDDRTSDWDKLESSL